MKYTVIDIGEEKFPISFGTTAMARFGSETKKSLKETEGFLTNIENEPLNELLLFIWCGLHNGHRLARKAGEADGLFQMEIEEVGDLIDTDSTFLERAMNALKDQQLQPGNGKPQTSKKKPTLHGTGSKK